MTTANSSATPSGPARAEPDGDLHFEGTGETAWGVKFVLVAAYRAARRLVRDDPVRQAGLRL